MTGVNAISPRLQMIVNQKKKNLNRLEDQASKNCMRFNKDKCEVLHLGWNNPKYPYRLSHPAENDLGFLVNSKLSMCQKYVLAAKTVNSILGYISKRKVTKIRGCDDSTPFNTCQATPGILCPVLIPRFQRDNKKKGKGTAESHQDNQTVGELGM
ncbi:mitochondrial enolase superfamily member 1 [Grus japonensis]|uniref:Mitochondrial enolase superfamily member 1 n=1 Tax=Grus japonensis TaxID=30415 RepID=A0ABC9XB29_GRUJA